MNKNFPKSRRKLRPVPVLPHILTPRETVQVIADLRVWGRWAETSTAGNHPYVHPLVAGRFKKHLPMALDEIETLIGKLDKTWAGPGLRSWNAWKYK